MSSLNDQINSFKARVRSAPVLGKRTVDAPGNGRPTKKPLPAHNIPQPTIMNAHTGTQLVHAIDYLKENECPVLLADLAKYLGNPVDALIPLFQKHSNIRYSQKDQTVCYVSRFDIYSGEDLLRYLQRQKHFNGVLVKDLKDGWSAAVPTINRLEQEQKILVLRNKKDDSPRVVWPNLAGPLGQVEKMFSDLWHASKVPSENDLPRELEAVGLKPSSQDPSSIKQNNQKKTDQKKRKRQHHGKFTNTHMRGVLKDYGA